MRHSFPLNVSGALEDTASTEVLIACRLLDGIYTWHRAAIQIYDRFHQSLGACHGSYARNVVLQVPPA